MCDSPPSRCPLHHFIVHRLLRPAGSLLHVFLVQTSFAGCLWAMRSVLVLPSLRYSLLDIHGPRPNVVRPIEALRLLGSPQGQAALYGGQQSTDGITARGDLDPHGLLSAPAIDDRVCAPRDAVDVLRHVLRPLVPFVAEGAAGQVDAEGGCADGTV